MTQSLLYALCALIVAFVLFSRRVTTRLAASYPPGPKPIPVLGNLRDLVARELWLRASEWAKQYGSVVYLHLFGVGLVFLNTPEATYDLLEKRGSIYSDKPQLTMANELCGCKNIMAFQSYGDQFRRQRKLTNYAFGPTRIHSYYPLIQSETRAFLSRLIASPDRYYDHLRRYAGGMTLFVLYGHQVKTDDDKTLALAVECVDLLANQITAGGGIWLVDILPSLRHLPTWLPGAGFRRKAQKWKQRMTAYADEPFADLQDRMKAGTAIPSFCSTLLSEGAKADPEIEDDIKHTANSMYSGSVDTTTTAVVLFILAMVQHPQVLRKAQAEIDRVIGTRRLPTFEDRATLPYVEAVMKETLRWGAPVPLSLPHRLMEDDAYEGMFIPKGSLIFGNIWAILRDEKLFPDADAFVPERYLADVDPQTARQMDPNNYVFGFGRRRCPGANLVDASVWALLAAMVATLDISKAVDEQGCEIEPDVVYENAVFRAPNPFKCDIRPRSDRALSIIQGDTNLTL